MKNNILTMFFLATAALAAGACQESIQYADVVYFTGTENSPVTSMYRQWASLSHHLPNCLLK